MVRKATLSSFEFPNQPGVLATVGAAVAVEDADVLGFTMCSKESMTTVHLVTEETDPALATLDTMALARRSRGVLLVRLGRSLAKLGDVGRRLADADVNVEATMSLDDGPTSWVALAVDEFARARKVLEHDEPLRMAP